MCFPVKARASPTQTRGEPTSRPLSKDTTSWIHTTAEEKQTTDAPLIKTKMNQRAEELQVVYSQQYYRV
eukprot:1553607-Karenia_brevis.AAC.1